MFARIIKFKLSRKKGQAIQSGDKPADAVVNIAKIETNCPNTTIDETLQENDFETTDIQQLQKAMNTYIMVTMLQQAILKQMNETLKSITQKSE